MKLQLRANALRGMCAATREKIRRDDNVVIARQRPKHAGEQTRQRSPRKFGLMNWDRIEGNRKQLVANVKRRWSRQARRQEIQRPK